MARIYIGTGWLVLYDMRHFMLLREVSIDSNHILREINLEMSPANLQNDGHCVPVSMLWHFPRYWPFVRGIHRSPVNSPHKGQWRGALMFSLICTWTNVWVNNRHAGDLRRYGAHYDVIEVLYRLMFYISFSYFIAIVSNRHVLKGYYRYDTFAQWQWPKYAEYVWIKYECIFKMFYMSQPP